LNLTRNEKHEYFVDGKRVPGVNEILKEEGIAPDFSNVPDIQWHCDLGTYTHNAIRMFFDNTLDESTLAGPVADLFAGFKKFQSEHNLIPDQVEKLMYSTAWNFAGEPDWVGSMDGVQTLIDWKKSASIYPAYLLTIPAYALLLAEAGTPVKKGIIVKLKPNNYEIVPMDITPKYWQALLLTRAWKQKNLKRG
jgi:hypothetical protein